MDNRGKVLKTPFAPGVCLGRKREKNCVWARVVKGGVVYHLSPTLGKAGLGPFSGSEMSPRITGEMKGSNAATP